MSTLLKRYFTHYWKNATWDYNVERIESGSDRTLRHTASNMFRTRGVSKGDTVYIITVKWGRLLLLTKLVVAEVCSTEKAARLLNNEDLWEAKDHIVAESPAPIRHTFDVPLSITLQLRFESSQQNKAPHFVIPGVLDQQTLRGVRELDYASAQLLEKILFTE
jgi:hypothetical protein